VVKVLYKPTTRKYKDRVSGQFRFVDPFPLGFGTLPEKMVYQKLSQMGIDFYYLNDLTFSDPAADYFKIFQADFYIPAANTIIEIQGAHWHTMPKTIEADAFKFAVYEVFGYHAIAWWDYDILDHLDALFASEPRLVALANYSFSPRSHELTPIARTKTDSSKGIRTLNRRHRKPLGFRSVGATKVRRKRSPYDIKVGRYGG
jgi:hypothetical protein